jgi:hypothetical protein
VGEPLSTHPYCASPSSNALRNRNEPSHAVWPRILRTSREMNSHYCLNQESCSLLPPPSSTSLCLSPFVFGIWMALFMDKKISTFNTTQICLC